MDDVKLRKLNLLIDQSKAFTQIIAKQLLPETSDVGDIVQPKLEYTQPKSVVNVQMKPHQLRGLNWMVNLFKNGLNGILADEMGLGKTLQAISLLCFLHEENIKGPYLIVAPLNVVPNWANEFERFAPSLNVLQYIGPKLERQNLRKKQWKKSDVIITSYDICMIDFEFFFKTHWTYLIVDEGHRLKNFKSKLFTSLKELETSNRLLLTGTPLQNNLVELWALLNFILPEVFHDFHTFKNYFNFEEFEQLKDDDDEEEGDTDDNQENSKMNSLINLTMKKALVTNLHTILKPFILRRLKKDVLKLPPKREYIIFSHHTPLQQKLYQGFLNTSPGIGTKNKRENENREKAASKLRLELLDTFLRIYVSYNAPKLLKEMDNFIKDIAKYYNAKSAVYDIMNGKSLEHLEGKKRKPQTVNALDLLMGKKRRKYNVNYNESSIYYSLKSEIEDECQNNDFDNDPDMLLEKLKSYHLYPYFESLEKYFKHQNIINPLARLRLVCASPYLICWPWSNIYSADVQSQYLKDENSLQIEDFDDDADLSVSTLDINSGKPLTPTMRINRFNDLVNNTAKLQTLESLIPAILEKNPNERILVFSQFVKTLQVLKIYFEDHPKLFKKINGQGKKLSKIFPLDTSMIHGSNSIEERNETFKEFSAVDSKGNLTGPSILLLSTKAANLGLNLTVASTVILYDCDFNPTVDAQAIARVHRIGQTKECIIYRLVSKSTVEEVIVRRGEGKTWLADVVVESGGFDGRLQNEESESLPTPTLTPESEQKIIEKEKKAILKINEKDSLLMTLYRLYKLLNRRNIGKDFDSNKLSELELEELTKRHPWHPNDPVAEEQTELDLPDMPRLRFFANGEVELK